MRNRVENCNQESKDCYCRTNTIIKKRLKGNKTLKRKKMIMMMKKRKRPFWTSPGQAVLLKHLTEKTEDSFINTRSYAKYRKLVYTHIINYRLLLMHLNLRLLRTLLISKSLNTFYMVKTLSRGCLKTIWWSHSSQLSTTTLKKLSSK